MRYQIGNVMDTKGNDETTSTTYSRFQITNEMGLIASYFIMEF